jgi:hypothetical protein
MKGLTLLAHRTCPVLCLPESAEAENMVQVPDYHIEQLKKDIEVLKAMLRPLESGESQLGERKPNGPWRDCTQEQIDHLKKTITEYQRIVDTRDA